jgi:hypothetical protein
MARRRLGRLVLTSIDVLPYGKAPDHRALDPAPSGRGVARAARTPLRAHARCVQDSAARVATPGIRSGGFATWLDHDMAAR